MAKGKVSLSPDQISEKWGRRMKGSVTDILTGIESVSESPAQKAIAKKDKMLTNLTKAINDGVWEKGLSKVSLAEWKTKTKEKVAQRLSGGVDGGMNKRKKFDTWLVSTLNQVLPEIKTMPDLTLSDSLERVRKMMEHMSNNRYKKT